MKLVGRGPVVLVDDDEVDIEILTRSFERSRAAESYELLAFRGGGPFLEYMGEVEHERAEIPSIVLLDINMPRMNGFEVLSKVRLKENFREVPAVMFVSNTDNPRDIERCNELGAGFQEKFDSMASCIEFYDGLVG